MEKVWSLTAGAVNVETIAQRYPEDVTFVSLISPRLVNPRKKLQF